MDRLYRFTGDPEVASLNSGLWGTAEYAIPGNAIQVAVSDNGTECLTPTSMFALVDWLQVEFSEPHGWIG